MYAALRVIRRTTEGRNDMGATENGKEPERRQYPISDVWIALGYRFSLEPMVAFFEMARMHGVCECLRAACAVIDDIWDNDRIDYSGLGLDADFDAARRDSGCDDAGYGSRHES